MFGMFLKVLTIKRYKPQVIVDGYTVSDFSLITVKLNVQPLNADELKMLNEGGRTIKRLKSYGADKLISNDEQSGTKGDKLWYHGKWYECKSSIRWEYTPLRHFKSEFTLCKVQEEAPETLKGATQV